MNTWRDINTAPKHQPVLVTVEGMVCFGRFCDFEDEDYSGLAFDGACLSDGESVSYFADYIDGWQPAPIDTRKQKEETFTEKTERIVSELQSMMDEKMYYGEMVGAPAPYCHDGPMVYENPEDYSLEKVVDILQRMLDGDLELPEKSADEMFVELGWELDMPSYNDLPCKYVNRHKWKIEFLHKDGTVEIGSIYGTFVLNEKTFLAIAKKIREMQNGSD